MNASLCSDGFLLYILPGTPVHGIVPPTLEWDIPPQSNFSGDNRTNIPGMDFHGDSKPHEVDNED